jgi:hypothetical protein
VDGFGGGVGVRGWSLRIIWYGICFRGGEGEERGSISRLAIYYTIYTILYYKLPGFLWGLLWGVG